MNKRILNTKCVDTLKDPVSSAQYTYKEYTNNNKKKIHKANRNQIRRSHSSIDTSDPWVKGHHCSLSVA